MKDNFELDPTLSPCEGCIHNLRPGDDTCSKCKHRKKKNVPIKPTWPRPHPDILPFYPCKVYPYEEPYNYPNPWRKKPKYWCSNNKLVIES